MQRPVLCKGKRKCRIKFVHPRISFRENRISKIVKYKEAPHARLYMYIIRLDSVYISRSLPNCTNVTIRVQSHNSINEVSKCFL